MDKDIIKLLVTLKPMIFQLSLMVLYNLCSTHPQIKPKLSKAIKEENKFDYESLIEEALINKGLSFK